MENEREQFLKMGVSRYADARATLDCFEQEIVERVAGILGRKRAWVRFDPTGYEIEDDEFNFEDSWGHWATACLTGRIDGDAKKKAQIEIGVWWDAPKQPPVLFYVRAWYRKEDHWLTADELKPTEPGVRVAEINSTYLISVPSEGWTFEESFESLIKEIEKGLIIAADE